MYYAPNDVLRTKFSLSTLGSSLQKPRKDQASSVTLHGWTLWGDYHSVDPFEFSHT